MLIRIFTIAQREFKKSFFNLSGLLITLSFLTLSWLATIYLGAFFAKEKADMYSFFIFHPWLYLLIIPFITMQVWSKEQKTGAIVLLLTLPITIFEIVMGKFIASLFFMIINLCLTFPLWIIVNLASYPHNHIILANYLVCMLMASSFVAFGLCFSAIFKRYTSALTASIIFFLGLLLAHLIPSSIIKDASNFSIVNNFTSLAEGVIELKNIVFFVSLTILGLVINTIVVNHNKILSTLLKTIGLIIIFIAVNIAVIDKVNLTIVNLKSQEKPLSEKIVIAVPTQKIDKIALASPDGTTSIISKKGSLGFILEEVAPENNHQHQNKIRALLNAISLLEHIDIIENSSNINYDYGQTYLLQISTLEGLIFNIDAFPYKSGFWINVALDTTSKASSKIKKFADNEQIKFDNKIYRIPIEQIRPLMTSIVN